MRIGIDARMYGPQQTGIGNYIKYLIEELVRLDKKNTYYIFLRKEEYSKFNNLSSSLNRLGIAQHLASGKKRNSKFSKILADFPWYSLVEQTLFLRALLKEPLDLMHFPHFNVPLLYSRPFIVTIHDITPKFSPGEKAGSSWPRRRAYDAVLRHAMNTSRAIITPSQFTKNDILNYFTIPPEKIHVIYEGIPTYLRAKDLLSAKSGMPRRQILKSKNPPFGQNLAARYVRSKNYLLYVGVWRSHKNLCGLLRAFAILKKEGFPHSLVLAGPSGQYADKVKSIWQNLGLQRWIIAPGFLSEEELHSFYQNAACVVFPSLYEGFGLVPLEALQAGTPVAVSDIPSLREILGESAFFFDPCDPQNMAKVIKNALTDATARYTKLNEAQRILPRYSWEENARKTLEIYETNAKMNHYRLKGGDF